MLVLVVLLGAGLAFRGPLRDLFTPDQAKTTSSPPSQQTQTADPGQLDENAPPERIDHNSVSEASQPPPAILQPESGTLAFEAQGQTLGEETYQLEPLATGGVKLSSSGYFAVKVFSTDVKFEYTQEIATTSDLRPSSFSLDFHGPLGLGNRSMNAQIEGGKAIISSGDKRQQIQVPQERFALLGMFSSYVLATQLIAGSDHTRLTAFLAAGFEGPAQTPQDSSPLLFPLEVTKLPSRVIRDIATAQEREVEVYRLQLGGEEPQDPKNNDSEGLRLLAANGEFLGLVGTSQDKERGSFKIYRIDLFPQGFEIVSEEE